MSKENSEGTAQDMIVKKALLFQRLGAEVAVNLDNLALLHNAELTPELLIQLSEFNFSEGLVLLTDNQTSIDSGQRLDEQLVQLNENASPAMLDLLAVDFAAIYLNYTYRASPLESVWMDDESLTYQDAMFGIRKVYQKHGLMVQNWRTRSDDHLVCQIEFMSKLFRLEGLNEERLQEIATFYDEHLFRWLSSFRKTVCTRCESEFYRLVARFTDDYLEVLRNAIAEIIEVDRPSREEVEARLAGRDLNAATYELKFVPGHSPSW